MTTSTLIPCPDARCLAFPFADQDEVDAHVVSGQHVFEITRRAGFRTETPAPPVPSTSTGSPGDSSRPRLVAPSEKAVAYLRTLLAERDGDLVEGIRLGLNAHREAGTLSAKVVSDAIDALKAIPVAKCCQHADEDHQAGVGCTARLDAEVWCPCKRRQDAPTPGAGTIDRAALEAIPAGRYLVGETFVRVDRPAEGQWAGFVFVKVSKDADGDGHRAALLNPNARTAKVDEAHRSVVEALVEDAWSHAIAYARSQHACGICNRKIETKESIERGIGPVCAAKFGVEVKSGAAPARPRSSRRHGNPRGPFRNRGW